VGGVRGADPPPLIGWKTAACGFQLLGGWTAEGYSRRFPAATPSLAPRALFHATPVSEPWKRVFSASCVLARPFRARGPAVGCLWGGCSSHKDARKVWIHKSKPGISQRPLRGLPILHSRGELPGPRRAVLAPTPTELRGEPPGGAPVAPLVGGVLLFVAVMTPLRPMHAPPHRASVVAISPVCRRRTPQQHGRRDARDASSGAAVRVGRARARRRGRARRTSRGAVPRCRAPRVVGGRADARRAHATTGLVVT